GRGPLTGRRQIERVRQSGPFRLDLIEAEIAERLFDQRAEGPLSAGRRDFIVERRANLGETSDGVIDVRARRLAVLRANADAVLLRNQERALLVPIQAGERILIDQHTAELLTRGERRVFELRLRRPKPQGVIDAA